MNKIIEIAEEKVLDYFKRVDKIKEYNSSNHRNEIIKLSNNIVLIDDCYNASFESIVSGLSQLKHYNH